MENGPVITEKGHRGVHSNGFKYVCSDGIRAIGLANQNVSYFSFFDDDTPPFCEDL